MIILENDVSKWQKKCTEVERDLKEHQQLSEKTPSGKALWASTTASYSKYTTCAYTVMLFNSCRDMTESNAIVPTLPSATPLKV